ncbi:MAG: AraC family transcriptional regulator ligand-binding domain-containing protein [Myxococcaceae bacterium]|nr:AraC family transcriptional regulator ligand-binding domain-containing protein [Myxococcaceae bacterium]
MASLPRAVLDLAALVGLDGAALATEANLSPTALNDPDGRVPVEGYRRLYERVHREPAMWEGMRLVAAMDSLGPLGVLGYVMANSPTVGQAFEAYERHATVIGEVFEFDVEASEKAFVLRFRVPPELQRFPLFNVGTVALNTAVVRILSGADVTPRLVELPNEQPEHLVDPSSLVPCTVQYGARDTVLQYAPEVATQPVRASDPTLFVFVERHARQLQKGLATPTTWSARAREVLLQRLRGEVPSVNELAKALATSERTLARRLEEEGQTFKSLLDEVRRELAVSYVGDRGLPLGEIAYLLGYSDAPSFHKAFKRWTGQTPGEFRRHGEPTLDA